ncbi:hypothetical protein [Vibrio spartinae]|uniref:Uncharacterized protein n=1 Tax=Vibrio spartinae TaxID=1918945 RepID=A0ABX6R3W0_9VIBR|nr:hypothetical protein [Vibrio spartinae]QMV15986.1 hypothetical protein Vspart_03360 [Vibrio spartinae]
MNRKHDGKTKAIWQEIITFFQSQNVTLVGYVLAAIIAAIGVGWLSTELKFLLLGAQGAGGLSRVTLVISGLIFIIILLLSIIPLREKRIQLAANPKAEHSLKQLPSDRQRILLLITLLLFTLLLDIGKDILQNVVKSIPYWVIPATMSVFFLLFFLAIRKTSATNLHSGYSSGSRLRKFSTTYFQTSSDCWLTGLVFVTGIAIGCHPPLSALHYLWLAMLGGYLFLHQVRRHAVPTNMLAEEQNIEPHQHLILFVSICQQYKIKQIKSSLPERIENLAKNATYPDQSKSNARNHFSKIGFVIMKQLFDAANQHSAAQNFMSENGMINVQNIIDGLCHIDEGSQFKLALSTDESEEPITDKHLVEIISHYVSYHLEQRQSYVGADTDSLAKFSDLIGVYDAVLTYFSSGAARTSWRMLFVALEKHLQAVQNNLNTPQIISLIVSDRGYSQDENYTITAPNAAGSNRQIDSLMKLLSLYLIYHKIRNHQIEFHLYKPGHSQPFTRFTSEALYNTPVPESVIMPDGFEKGAHGANFYEFDSCMHAVQSLVSDSSISEWDTIVDFTSGNKVASMVATFMTTTTDVKAQYVDEKYNVNLFDLRYYDLAKLGG